MTYTTSTFRTRNDHKMSQKTALSTRIADERKIPRIQDNFPVTVVPMRGFLATGRIPGELRDFHEEAACIKTRRDIAVGRKVLVRLRIPRCISRFYHGLPCEVSARVFSVRAIETGGEKSFAVVLRWDRPLSGCVRQVVKAYRRKMALLVAFTLAVLIWAKYQTSTFFWYDPVIYVYSFGLMGFLVSRFVLAWMHDPPALSGYMPSLSVVISVRNEEENISKGITTCFETDYPTALREVIVVDDGSTDRTPEVLRELQRRFPDLKVYTIPPSGKRRGMAEGVLRAHGEIIVFMDSDTFLAPDALRHIVCGFEDPSLGAASGFTGVGNAEKNALTGLQEIRYLVSFQLLKTSESLFGCVTCCPGCLSAYRREYVLEVLKPWLEQMFMGNRATFGDDRSLTNFILRKYRVIYNERAIAYTMVPERWGQYLRQQNRWKKSWIRESFLASGFMYQKPALAAISFYTATAFSLFSPAMSFRVAYLGLRLHDGLWIYYILGLIGVGLLQSFYYLYKRASPRWLLGLYWMATSLLITGPQTYYSLLTLRKNHWGTR